MVSNLLAVPLGGLCVVMSFLTYFVSLFGIIPLTAFAVLLATKCDALLIDFCMKIDDIEEWSIIMNPIFILVFSTILVMISINIPLKTGH